MRALGDARATILDFDAGEGTASGAIALTGTLRGSQERFEEWIGIRLTVTPRMGIAHADVTIAETARAKVQSARAAD